MAPCTAAEVPATPAISVSWDRASATQQQSRTWLRQLDPIDASTSGVWARYLRSVYGESVKLPIDLRRLRWFWWWAPGASDLTRIEAPIWRRTHPGDLWVPGMKIERHLAQAGFFVHPLSPGTGSVVPANDGLLEVMRVSHPSGESSNSVYGLEAGSASQTWYWHAPGSGIYLRIGRSLVVRNRTELLVALAQLLPDVPLPVTRRMHVSPERGLRICDGCSEVEPWNNWTVLWPSRNAPAVNDSRVGLTYEGAHKIGSDISRGSVIGSSAGRDSAGDDAKASNSLCGLIRRAGYDTLLLTDAFDSERFEIVDCRGNSQQAANPTEDAAARACPSRSSGSAPHLLMRRGQSHDQCECTDQERAFLNCGAHFVGRHLCGSSFVGSKT